MDHKSLLVRDTFHPPFKEWIRSYVRIMASILSLCGFSALLLFSSKSGLSLVAVASAINTSSSVSDSVAIFKGINHQSTSLKKFNGHHEFADPIIHLLGSLLNLIALVSISKDSSDKMPMVWFGLFGSFLIYIGGLLNVLKVSRMH